MFDLNVKGNSYETNLNLAYEASRYGWEHINFSYNQNDFEKALDFKGDLQDDLNDVISIDYTLEIKSDNLAEIRKIANKFRFKSSCISVVGGNLKVNRGVLENVKIDVLSRPYLGNYNGGLNHVLAKEAVKNNVAIELSFSDVLKTYFTHRSKIIANFKDIYTLYRKFNFPLILSSCANSVFDFRSIHDFRAFFKSTGLSDEEIDNCFNSSKNILDFNSNRENFILNGVLRVDNEA